MRGGRTFRASYLPPLRFFRARFCGTSAPNAPPFAENDAVSNLSMPKYLLIYEKGESIRWLGHLDILRTVERAIRRAALPIAFSNGFNPRERIAFASALATGITAAAERATLELTDALPTDEIQRRLNDALPPGIRIHECREISDAEAKEMLSGYDRAEYEVVCDLPPETASEAIERGIAILLSRSEIIIKRERESKSKIVDIRPSIYALTICPEPVSASRIVLQMVVGQGESGTGKTDGSGRGTGGRNTRPCGTTDAPRSSGAGQGRHRNTKTKFRKGGDLT